MAQQFGLNIRYRRQFQLDIIEARNLLFHGKEAPNPYCQISCAYIHSKIPAVMKTNNPHWNNTLPLSLNSISFGQPMTIEVKHHSTGIFSSDQLIGICSFLPSQIQEGIKMDQWLPIFHQEKKNQNQHSGEIHCSYLLSPPLVDSFLFVVKKNAWSFGDFRINDESGSPCFFVEGSWPKSFFFKSKTGQQIVHIKKRSLIAIEPSYDIYQAGTQQLLMTITRRIAFMAVTYDIETNGDFLDIKGDIFSQCYKFIRRRTGEVVVDTHREYFSWTDTYLVEIAPTENVPLLLACVVVLEHEEQKRRQ